MGQYRNIGWCGRPDPLKYIKNGSNQKTHFYKKQCFVTLYISLSKLSTWKLSTKFYEG